MHITSPHRGARARVVHARAWQHAAGTQSRSVLHSCGGGEPSFCGVTALPPGPTMGGISLPLPCGGDGCRGEPDCTDGLGGGHALGDIGPGSA